MGTDEERRGFGSRRPVAPIVVLLLLLVALPYYCFQPKKKALPEPPPIVDGNPLIAGKLASGNEPFKLSATVIIGVASHIGSALAQQLLMTKERVVGIDTFYGQDGRMRWQRVESLFSDQDPVAIVQGSGCNSTLMAELFRRYAVTQVISLEDHCGCAHLRDLVSPNETQPQLRTLLHSSADEACGSVAAAHRISLRVPETYGPWQWPYLSESGAPTFEQQAGRAVFVKDAACGLVRLLRARGPAASGVVSAGFAATLPTSRAHKDPAGTDARCSLVPAAPGQALVAGYTPRAQGVESALAWAAELEAKLMPCETSCAATFAAAPNTAKGPSRAPALPRCFASSWGRAAEASRRATEGCSVVIYTVLIGAAKEIHPLPAYWDQAPACHVAFVSEAAPLLRDEPRLRKARWHFVVVPALTQFADSRKASRLPKLSPEAFFAPSVAHAVYLDSKLEANMRPETLLRLFREGDGPAESTALLLVRHSVTRDLRHDAELVLASHRSDITHYPELLRRQVLHYGRLPLCYADTFDGAFIVHDLRSAAARRLRCTWLREFLLWSDRDQISGAYAIALHSHHTLPPQAQLRGRASERCAKRGERIAVGSDGNVTSVLKMLRADKYYWRDTDLLAKWQRLD